MTKTITHEGVEYRKVKRKAEVGELVYVFGQPVGANGVQSVDAVSKIGHITYGYFGRKPTGYHVLEPIEDEEIPQTPVEASPTVIELLANISRRLYEAEQTIKEQAYEINELYKAVSR